MIAELLSRIHDYDIRVREAYERQNAEIFGDYDDEDLEEDELIDGDPEEDSIKSDDDSENDTSSQMHQIPFVFPYAYEPEKDTVEYDQDQEIIRGHINAWKYPSLSVTRKYSVSPDNPWYFDIDGVVFSKETGLLVSFPPEKGEEYIIPEDDRITGIGEYAFAGNSRLKKITLSARIQYVGRYAFAGCTALSECTIPSWVHYLGTEAFALCTSLKRASIDCFLNEIPYGLFRNDTELTSVRFTSETERISRRAFSGCTSLIDLKTHGTENKEIDVILPPSTKIVCGEAFLGCRSIRSIQMPSVTKIEDRAFAGCTALSRFQAEKMEEYKAYCFQECAGLEEFSFGQSTRKLGRVLFDGARNLKIIRFSCAPGFSCAVDALPDNVEYLVDTTAYLESGKLYQCQPLFRTCVKNISKDEEVPDTLYQDVVQTLRRNRKKLYDWFLSEPDVLDLTIREEILGCDDCLAMIQMADDPEMADKIRTHMNSCFSRTKIASIVAKREKAEREKREAEEKARKHQEEMEKQRAEHKMAMENRFSTGVNIDLEEMNLSVRAYNCLKRHGINTLQELAGMCEEDLMKVRNLGRKSMMEVVDKLESLTGIRIPVSDEEFLGKRQMVDDFSVDDLAGLNLDDNL